MPEDFTMLYTFSHTRRERSILPLTINLLGYHYAQEPVSRTKGLSLFQWICCADGMGEFIIRGQKSVLSPGQTVLIYPYEPHSYHALTEEWHVHIIGFSGNCCIDIMKTLKMHESGIYHFSRPDIFRSYFEKIIQVQQEMSGKSGHNQKKREPRRQFSFLMQLSKLCYEFLLDLSSSIHFVSTSVPDSGNETIRLLISYMEEHYPEPLSLEQLAEQAHLSRGYLCDLFKREMKQTIMQYLTNLRISQARILLTEFPERRVSEIGRMCGFESPSYFGEIFRRVVGMTPAEYRLS